FRSLPLWCTYDRIELPIPIGFQPRMRRKLLNVDAYDTDKIRHGYLDGYDAILAPWVDKEITLLELGVYRGGSLKLWRDYFPRGAIVGTDSKLPPHFRPGERIQ